MTTLVKGCVLAYQLLAIDYLKRGLKSFSSHCLRGTLARVSTFNMTTRKMLAHVLLVPIIAIFTKYDQLVDHICIYDESITGPDDEEAKVKAKLDQLCVTFREQIGETTKIPQIAVSSECDN